MVKIPFESTSLFTGLGQLLGIPTEVHLGCLQVSLQHLHLFTQLWKKGEKLRNRLREKSAPRENKKVRTDARGLKGRKILCLPSRLLVQPGTRVLHPHHLVPEREHLSILWLSSKLKIAASVFYILE